MSESLVSLSAGEVLFRQGYPADYAYIVKQGEIEIIHEAPDGSEKRLAILKDGEMFGELGIIDDAPRSATARAYIDCILQVMEI